jgi:GWxTD domain-containing protein
MSKKIILFLLILTTAVLAQENRSGILLEKNILPADSGYSCYISFRIPYNKLFFIKEDNKFTSRFNFSFEAVDSSTGKIVREINNGNFSVASYNETKYDEKFYQGIVRLNLLPGTYKIIPIFTNENSSNQARLKDIKLTLKPVVLRQVYQPVLLEEKKISCSNDSAFILANYEGNVPFSATVYKLVIPVRNSTIDKLNIEIVNNDSLIYKGEISESYLGKLLLSKCGNNLVCESLKGNMTRNFVLKGFNQKLNEGPLKIKIQNGKDTTSFNKYVTWYDKPYTLKNFSIAAKLLRYITDDPEIVKINRNETERSVKIFGNFWKKIDPTPESSFNELLEEFYSRADYSVKEFTVVNGKNGAETDRGKIYIQLGKPHNIERLYSENNSTQEVWYYKNPDRKFVFTDKSGLGNFVLENESL